MADPLIGPTAATVAGASPTNPIPTNTGEVATPGAATPSYIPTTAVTSIRLKGSANVGYGSRVRIYGSPD